MMTPEQLAEIRVRLARVLTAPWAVDDTDSCGVSSADQQGWIADCGFDEDAAFIAHAPQDIQDMLAYIAELEDQLGYRK